MGRSYSKIRHIQESNQILEKRLMSEQAKPTLTAPTASLTPTTQGARQTSTLQPTTNVTSGVGGVRKAVPNSQYVKGTDTFLDVITFGLDPHTLATIGQVAAAVLIPPPGGLMVSAAIGAADAYKYATENNPKVAGLTLLLSALPGIGGLANKIPGVKQLGAKGMAALSDKIAKGVTKLLPEEGAVINYIKANPKLVQMEYASFIDNTAKKLASTGATQVRTNATKAGYNATVNSTSSGG
jgi:hypothetical protein